jgi:hypothetical protein
MQNARMKDFFCFMIREEFFSYSSYDVLQGLFDFGGVTFSPRSTLLSP